MDSGRFETFIDAILAIMMTVIVLKIPQPETMTFAGIWDLRIMYYSYFLSFLIIFSIWNHHRKFFDLVEDINNRVITLYSLLIFAITMLPYFTAWVAHNPYDVVPELMFGIIFFIISFLYIFTTKATIKHDYHNNNLDDLEYKEHILIDTVLFSIGILLIYFGYPLFMLILCLLCVISWNITPYFNKRYLMGDNNGN